MLAKMVEEGIPKICSTPKAVNKLVSTVRINLIRTWKHIKGLSQASEHLIKIGSQ